MYDFSNTKAFLERFKEYGKRISPSNIATINTNLKLPAFDDKRFVHRDTLTKKLFEKIQNNQFVNLWGVGGNGKTTLLQLMCKKFENQFCHVAYSEINGNIKEDIYIKLKNSSKFGLKDKKCDAKGPDKQYEWLISELSHEDVSQSINLFVIDINNYAQRRKEINSFFESFENITEEDGKCLYPDGWKVLVISRESIDSKSCLNFTFETQKINEDEEKDLTFLTELFWNCTHLKKDSKSAVDELFESPKKPTKELVEIFRKLCLSPLLVKILGIQSKLNVEYIYKVIKNIKLLDSVKSKEVGLVNREQIIGEYLDNLVKFRKLDNDEKLITILFIVWPTEYLSVSFINELANGYYIGQDCGDLLEKLFDKGLLTKQGDDSYSMHSLLAEVLRRQFLEKFDNPESFKKILFPLLDSIRKLCRIYPKYRRYIDNCLNLSNNNDYLNVIVSSLDKDICSKKVRSLLNQNHRIQSFYEVNLLKKEIDRKDNQNDQLKLSDLHFKLAELLYDKLGYYSEALVHYCEALNKNRSKAYYRVGLIYTKLHKHSRAIEYFEKCIDLKPVNKYTALSYCYLNKFDQACEVFDMIKDFLDAEEKTWSKYCYARKNDTIVYDSPLNESVSLYEAVLSVMEQIESNDSEFLLIKANTYCRLADACFLTDDKKSYDLYLKSITFFDKYEDDIQEPYSKKNMADAYYRGALMYEQRHPLSDNLKDRVYSYYKASDKIWASLPLETDGNLKGFVRTPYGIYIPMLDLKLVKVSGGEFWMGAQKDDQSLPNYDEVVFQDESPVHEVTLNDYYIGETQVTQRLWEAIMGEKNNPSRFHGDDNPVEKVDWFMAVDFCNKLSQRLHLTPVYMITEVIKDGKPQKEVKINKDANGFKLPTEAEWEYAARGGKSGGTKYSGSDNIDDVAVYHKNSYDLGSNNSAYGTHQVKSKKPNFLGIYDMSGNVWEWCQDWYGDYPSGSVINPTGPNSGSDRVLRGGSWVSDARYCRVSDRDWYDPDSRYYFFGFRLSLSSQQKNEKE